MSGRGRVLVLVLLAAAAVCPVAAQPADPAAEVFAQRVELANRETAEAVAASLRAENGAVEQTPRTSGITLEAARDASSARLTLSPGAGGRWSLAAATPIQKADPTTDLATLRGGLADDVEVSFAFHDEGFAPFDVDRIDVQATIARQEQLCLARGFEKTCDVTDIERDLPTARARRAALDYESVVLKDRRVVPIPDVFAVQRWEIEATVGRTERSYFSETAEELDEDRLTASFGGSYGRLIGSAEWKLDARWQRKYEAQKAARHCTPVEGTALERCKELPLGRAAEKDLFPIALEWRQRSGENSRFPWAISPRLVYEVEEEVWGVSFPVYLVRDANDVLSGGVAVDWQEGKDTVVSVFVSAPLSALF